jgi:hypothetical protein
LLAAGCAQFRHPPQTIPSAALARAEAPSAGSSARGTAISLQDDDGGRLRLPLWFRIPDGARRLGLRSVRTLKCTTGPEET